MIIIKKFILYALRWQLSTLTLAPVLIIMANQNKWVATIVANAIGSGIFFFVDRYIFKSSIYYPLWEVQEDVKCVDCGQVARGYRLVKAKNYDRSKSIIEFRCEKCSKIKSKELKNRGIKI